TMPPANITPKTRISGNAILAEIENVGPKLKQHRQQFTPRFSSSLASIMPSIFSQLGVQPISPQATQTIVAQAVRQSLENVGRVQSTPQLRQVVADALTQGVISQEEIAKGGNAEQIYEKVQEPANQIVTQNQKALEEEAVLSGIAQIASLEKPDQQTNSIVAQEIQSTVDSVDPLMPPDQQGQLFESVSSYLAKNRDSLNNQLTSYSEDNLPSLEQFQEIKEKAHDQAVSQLPESKSSVDIKDLAATIGTELGTKPLDEEQADKFGLGFAQPTRNTFSADGLEGKIMALTLASNEKAQEEAVSALISHDKEKAHEAEKLHDPQHFHFIQKAKKYTADKPKKTQQYLTHFQKLTGGTTKASQTVWRTTRAYTNYYPGIFVPQNIVNSRIISLAAMSSLARSYGSFSIGSTVSSARGLSSGLKNAIGVGKDAVQAAKLALGASNPAGWAMLAAKFAPQIKTLVKNIAKGAAAFYGLMLYMFGLKVLGALAGLAFGAITGLPLLFIPIAGPFLYAGWIAGNVIRGWINPTAEIHLATHPFSVFSGPIGFIQGLWSGLGSTISGAGSALVGATATVWGGITGTAGGLVGALGAGTSTLFGALGSLSVPASAMVIPIVAIPAVGIWTFFLGSFITAPAFFSTEDSAPLTPSENEFFSVTKTSEQRHLENPPPDKVVKFTITIKAKAKKISGIEIADSLKVFKESSSFAPENVTLPPNPCPAEIEANASCQFSFNVTVDSKYVDSIITNSVTVKATPEAETQKTSTASTSVTVGNPPTNDPNGWPTCGKISQGPWSNPPLSHSSDGYRSSVDIDNAIGTKIYSTHKGVVTFTGPDSNGGIYVAVRGTNYITFYVHLLAYDPNLRVGQTINAGTLVGRMDTTGTANASHLHYMIRDINNKEIPAASFNSLVPSYNIYGDVTSSWGGC
ncbi:MAG: M23 family metallopeptidase, partial [Candidatus Curtissbacteria bacterium]